GSALGRVGEWRMMHGNDYGSRVVARLDLLQLRAEEGELVVGDGRPFRAARADCLLSFRGGGASRFARNHARIFERVREQAEDANERRIEGEINAGLQHARAVE